MFRSVLVFTFAILLFACGGGGPGDSPIPTGSMVTISPDTALIGVGESLPLRIVGGVGPYSLVSSNPKSLSVPSLVENMYSADLTVTAGNALQSEVVIITVTDSKGQSAKSTVTLSSISIAISPSKAAIDAGQTLPLRIVGGAAPYRLVSSNPQALPVPGVVDNSNVTLTVTAGDALQTEAVSITVIDSKGESATATVTVRSLTSTMVLSPASLTLASTNTQTFRFSGGRPPFIVTTTRPELLILNLGGLPAKEFTVFANDVLTQVADIGVSVTDATGNSVSAKVSLIPYQVFKSVQVERAIDGGQVGVLRIEIGAGYSVPRRLVIQQLSGSPVLDGADATGRLAVDVGNDHIALAQFVAATPGSVQTGKLRVTDTETGQYVERVY